MECHMYMSIKQNEVYQIYLKDNIFNVNKRFLLQSVLLQSVLTLPKM